MKQYSRLIGLLFIAALLSSCTSSDKKSYGQLADYVKIAIPDNYLHIFLDSIESTMYNRFTDDSAE